MKIEKAKIADVPQMHRLINYFADKGELLPRSMSELYENLRDFFVVRDSGEVMACGALHILWSDLTEIKALAVAESQQEQGLGEAIVQACLEEARNIGVPSVFCLTYKASFFERFGFLRIDVMELPRKVWGECQRCPKFPNCDETAMILHL
jgi:amino-acid N-acetyltransferase